MKKTRGYQPKDGDRVRIAEAQGVVRQWCVGRVGIAKWRLTGIEIRFDESFADGSVFSEAFGLKCAGIVFNNPDHVTLEASK